MPGLLRKCLFITVFGNFCCFLNEILYTPRSSTQITDEVGLGGKGISLIISLGFSELHYSSVSVLVCFPHVVTKGSRLVHLPRKWGLFGITVQLAGTPSKSIIPAPEKREKEGGSHGHSPLEQSIPRRGHNPACSLFPVSRSSPRHQRYIEKLMQHMHSLETHANHNKLFQRRFVQPFDIQLCKTLTSDLGLSRRTRLGDRNLQPAGAHSEHIS